eukprot:gene28188-31286_t
MTTSTLHEKTSREVLAALWPECNPAHPMQLFLRFFYGVPVLYLYKLVALLSGKRKKVWDRYFAKFSAASFRSPGSKGSRTFRGSFRRTRTQQLREFPGTSIRGSKGNPLYLFQQLGHETWYKSGLHGGVVLVLAPSFLASSLSLTARHCLSHKAVEPDCIRLWSPTASGCGARLHQAVEPDCIRLWSPTASGCGARLHQAFSEIVSQVFQFGQTGPARYADKHGSHRYSCALLCQYNWPYAFRFYSSRTGLPLMKVKSEDGPALLTYFRLSGRVCR